MGLFDAFKKKAAPVKPEAIQVTIQAGALAAPIAGRVIPMTEVPDPIFSSEALGRGCAVWPEGDTVYAPVAGTVSVAMGHAVGIVSPDGVEVLVHIGVDTVNMQGKGFTGYAAQGAEVAAGDPLITMDRSAIAAAGHPDCVVMAVSNTADFAAVELAVEPGSTVAAGDALVTVAR